MSYGATDQGNIVRRYVSGAGAAPSRRSRHSRRRRLYRYWSAGGEGGGSAA